MKLQIVLVLILFSFQITFSQTKTVKGDTVYWFKRNKIDQKTFNLKDLELSTDEFNFRLSYYGQIIEITKNGSSINGFITNYTYHTKKANRQKTDTLFDKIILSSEKAEYIYNTILNSEILKLKSDNNIKSWQHGLDGITYTIEQSDSKNYWLKKYWTPSSQDSIPEAFIVLNFLKNLSDSLNLNGMYTTFKNGLPHQGCYSSGGGAVTCYISNTFELGYSGAKKLPLGFYTSYSASYIGKTEVNSGISLQYNFDNNNFYHLNFMVSKWNILHKDSEFSDFIAYNYQNRKLNIDNPNNKFQNHQIKYGLNLKNNFGIGTGVDYLINNYNKIGGHFYAFKYFSKPSISTVLITSIFNDRINYKAQIFKSFYPSQSFLVRRVTLGLAYENFMNYKDVYFNVQVSL